MSLQVRGQGLMSVPPTPASCDFGSASCTHSGLVFIGQGSVSLTFEEHCLGPLVCVLQHEAGGCVCVCTCVCVCARAHVHQPQLPPPRSPPCLSPSSEQRVEGRGWAPAPAARWRVWSRPQAAVFLPHHSVDPPHYFCSCSVAVSTLLPWTFSVLPERYLVCVAPAPSLSLLAFPPSRT